MYIRTIAFVAFDKTTGTKIPDQKCLLEIERTEPIWQYKLRCNNLKAIRFANCNILWVTDHKVYKSWKKMKVPTKILQNLTPWMWKKHSALKHTLAVLFQCKPGLLGSLLFLRWQTRAVSCISEFSDLVNECKWPKISKNASPRLVPHVSSTRLPRPTQASVTAVGVLRFECVLCTTSNGLPGLTEGSHGTQNQSVVIWYTGTRTNNIEQRQTTPKSSWWHPGDIGAIPSEYSRGAWSDYCSLKKPGAESDKTDKYHTISYHIIPSKSQQFHKGSRSL